ncbi:hypothetical protein [Peribacillus frigoritolerans]|uniref:hypothetical protein n=1 Tax=Peribacillus frigoritolerans TaxID=450367 RepID=UPI0039A304B9
MEPQACSVHDFLITSGIYEFTRCFRAFTREFHALLVSFMLLLVSFVLLLVGFVLLLVSFMLLLVIPHIADIFSHSSVFPKEKDKACQLCPCSCFP